MPILATSLGWLLRHRSALHEPGAPLAVLPGIAIGAVLGVWLQAGLAERASLLLLPALLSFAPVVSFALKRLATRVTPGAQVTPLFGLPAGMTESALNAGAPFMLLFEGSRGLRAYSSCWS